MARMHRRDPRCEITGKTPASVHHVLPRGQGGDDDARNLVMLEGDGVTGLHGQITRNEHCALVQLGEHLFLHRPDTIAYVKERLGEEAGVEWLRRRLFIL